MGDSVPSAETSGGRQGGEGPEAQPSLFPGCKSSITGSCWQAAGKQAGTEQRGSTKTKKKTRSPPLLLQLGAETSIR